MTSIFRLLLAVLIASGLSVTAHADGSTRTSDNQALDLGALSFLMAPFFTALLAGGMTVLPLVWR